MLDFSTSFLRWKVIVFGLLLLACRTLHADVAEDLMKGVFKEGITVDLREPTFCEGTLTTEHGGVITGPGIRIQALNITYTKKMEEGLPICTIVAEGDLLLEFGNYIFVGERLEYNFQTSSGTISCGRTAVEPWFIGGDTISLCPDGSFIIYHAYITTSENVIPDWEITAKEATFRQERYVCAKDVRFIFLNIPLLWVPSFSTDLQTISEHPLRYIVGWGGRQGPRLGIAYEMFSNDFWKVFLRLDYRLKRGPGGGFETRYRSEDRKQEWETINYLARDVSIFNTHERTRYRFQGTYSHLLCNDTLSIDFTYDKLSDEDMAADYADQSLELMPSERTELQIRKQEDWWITNLYARARINYFETVKQELPTIETYWRPFQLGDTGIISDNQITTSYLDFAYARQVPCRHNYRSTRAAFLHRLYRPFVLGNLTVTPEAGGTAILYGNGPHGEDRKCLVEGLFSCDAYAPFFRVYDWGKHVITPYAQYQYYTFPTVSPHDHYIFDINDGLYRLSMMRFGLDQSFYKKDHNGCLLRYLHADIYANAFFDIDTIPQTIPKIYSKIVWNVNPVVRNIFDAAWDFEENQLDHFNTRIMWTVSADFAITAEYRHRDSFDWRKCDKENFVLDCFRSIEELRHSQLSDRRDTALLHFFYRFHPKWAVEFISLSGWNRRNRTRYTEFEVDVHGTIHSACQTKFAFQHRQGDTRFAIYFYVAAQGPDRYRTDDLIPFLSF